MLGAESCDISRVVYTYAHAVRCAGVHAQKCESKALEFHVSQSFGFLFSSATIEKTMCEYPSGQVGLMSAGHARPFANFRQSYF